MAANRGPLQAPSRTLTLNCSNSWGFGFRMSLDVGGQARASWASWVADAEWRMVVVQRRALCGHAAQDLRASLGLRRLTRNRWLPTSLLRES